MGTIHEDRFLVFLRIERAQDARPDVAEHALTACATFAEARRVQREYRNSSRECVIRYIGPTGGGD